MEPLEACKEDLLVVINQEYVFFVTWFRLHSEFVLIFLDPLHCLLNQVHTEAYLNSLKCSFRVASIVEVVIFLEEAELAMIGSELCVAAS